MAGASLLTLLDDIATVLDDVAVMTKKAASKTAGVLGDDLALNAEQVSGVRSSRELPVVWAVAKGSAINKLILVPAALLISVFLPWIILPLLMIGGAYLCFEGTEKLWHAIAHRAQKPKDHAAHVQALARPSGRDELLALERGKIRGAIRTDFILSAEIIVIALGTVAQASLGVQAAVLTGIAVLMTVGVYGLVAAIVRIDDVGLDLQARENPLAKRLGQGLLVFAPWLMRFLSIAGTAAMFLVGGGILVHGIPPLHHLVADLDGAGQGALMNLAMLLAAPLLNFITGLLAGAVLLAALQLKSMWAKPAT